LCRAVLETIAIVSGLHNVAVVGEPVEQRSRHLGVSKDADPLREAQVGRDDDARALVELAEQVEEQSPTVLTEWQIAELVENHDIRIHQTQRQLARLPHQLLLLNGVDEFDGREEAHTTSIMFDRLYPDRRRQVRFTGARRTSNILPIIMATTLSFAIRFIRASASASTSLG